MSAFESKAGEEGYENYGAILETLNAPATLARPATPQWQEIVNTVLIADAAEGSRAGRRQRRPARRGEGADRSDHPVDDAPTVRSVETGSPVGAAATAPPRTVTQAKIHVARSADRRFALLLMAPAAAVPRRVRAVAAHPVRLDGFFEISPIAGGPREFVGFDNFARRSPRRPSRARRPHGRLHRHRRRARVHPRPRGGAHLRGPRRPLGGLPHDLHVPAHDRARRRRVALAVPAHRQLRHPQRTAAAGGHPDQDESDRVAQRPEHRALLGRAARHLADHLVHHTRVVRRAAEHPRRRGRGGAARRARFPTCCSASSSRCCGR